MARLSFAVPIVMAVALTAGSKTDNAAGDVVNSVGNTAGHALGGAVSLVNVDLSNVLNDLSLDLKIDKANIPINAQIPITLAANVCGVSINILSVSTGGSPNCTATTTSPDLAQAVQQQLAANGSVGGGAQTSSDGAATGSTAPTTTTTGAGTTTTTTTTSPTSPAVATPGTAPTNTPVTQ
jgi:hypothetical protein